MSTNINRMFPCIQFFTTEPFACEPSSLPKYPPSKELDVKRRDEEAKRFFCHIPSHSEFCDIACCCLVKIMGLLFFIYRQRDLHGKAQAVDGTSKVPRDEITRATPAPEANAELETSLEVSEYISFIRTRISVVRCEDRSYLNHNYVAFLFTISII